MGFGRRMNKLLIAIGLLLICGGVVVTISSQTYMHESAHKQIMIYHGCNEVELRAGLLTGHTKCLDLGDQVFSDNEYLLHSINDIVSYNLHGFLYLLGFLTVGGCCLLAGLIREDD